MNGRQDGLQRLSGSFGEEKKSISAARILIPYRPASSLITILTTLIAPIPR
jgi:hypothetical protein